MIDEDEDRIFGAKKRREAVAKGHDYPLLSIE
jgi:hypothetical protein